MSDGCVWKLEAPSGVLKISSISPGTLSNHCNRSSPTGKIPRWVGGWLFLVTALPWPTVDGINDEERWGISQIQIVMVAPLGFSTYPYLLVPKFSATFIRWEVRVVTRTPDLFHIWPAFSGYWQSASHTTRLCAVEQLDDWVLRFFSCKFFCCILYWRAGLHPINSHFWH